MKLVWCPDTASKAYIDAVNTLSERDLPETSVAEFVSAMAGGWKAQLVVEAWSREEGDVATSIALQAATRHVNGRHVCFVPDEQSAAEYAEAMRRSGTSTSMGESSSSSSSSAAATEAVVVGEAEDVMRELEGVDLMVVDCRRTDVARVLREARPGPRGMVVLCKSAGRRRGSTAALLGAGRRVVRSTFLPLGGELMEVLHVGIGKGPSMRGGDGGGGSGLARWVRHVDSNTKEEHVYRR